MRGQTKSSCTESFQPTPTGRSYSAPSMSDTSLHCRLSHDVAIQVGCWQIQYRKRTRERERERKDRGGQSALQ